MKRIEIKLNLAVVAPLLDVIRGLAEGLQQSLAAPLQMTDLDADFVESWKAELLEGQGSDVAVLLALFDEKFFAEGTIGLNPTNADAVLRACAAVRLRLRERYLKDLGDDSLETSDVDLETLDETKRKAFLSYLFLATLQEIVIQHLDPSVMDS